MNYYSKIILLFTSLAIYITASTQNRAIDSLQVVLRNQGGDTNKVNTLNNLSYELRQLDNKKALQYAGEAILLAEKLNFQKGIAIANLNNGFAYFDQDYTESLKYFLEALKVSKEIDYKTGIADSYNNIARCNSILGNYPEAIKNHLAAIEIYEELGDKQGMGRSFQWIGSAYMSQGDNAEALKNILASFKIHEELGDRYRMAQNHNSIGTIYLGQNRFAEALEKHVKALNIFEEPDAPVWGLPWTYRLIGAVYEQQGDLYNEQQDRPSAEAKFLEAEKYYRKALPIWEKINNKQGMSDIYISLGIINRKQNSFSLAKEYLGKGLRLSKETGNKTDIQKSYLGLSELDSLSGNYKEAYAHYKMYALYRDSLVNEGSTKKMAQEKMQFEFNRKEALAMAEQDKKTAKARQMRNIQYIAIGVFFLLAAFLFLNNRRKQKANTILEKTLSHLKATQTQLIQSEKMASLGELTAGIAHEIQNPLNFVNNFSEVSNELIAEMNTALDKGDIKEAKAIANDVQHNLEKINHHGKRAADIVKGMLQHSRSSNGVKEPTDINALCDEYLRLSYHGLRAKDKNFNATMNTDFDGSIGKINIIPQDIGRVVLNLLTNSFYAVGERSKAGSPDQSIGIVDEKKTLGQTQGDNDFEPTVTVCTKKQDGKVEIRVIDNGNGIPQNIIDKIFQPLFTTKPTGQGTGLGLSLSYDIIKAHGGELKVETKEGEGSTFIILLPVNNN